MRMGEDLLLEVWRVIPIDGCVKAISRVFCKIFMDLSVMLRVLKTCYHILS